MVLSYDQFQKSPQTIQENVRRDNVLGLPPWESQWQNILSQGI
jgi:hypothetical protein